jgi:hypothetical protein
MSLALDYRCATDHCDVDFQVTTSIDKVGPDLYCASCRALGLAEHGATLEAAAERLYWAIQASLTPTALAGAIRRALRDMRNPDEGEGEAWGRLSIG